jgi:hypothetical protein
MDGKEIVIGYAVGYNEGGEPIRLMITMTHAQLNSAAEHLCFNPALRTNPNATAWVQGEVMIAPDPPAPVER